MELFPVDIRHSLGSILSSYLLIDSASHEPELLFNTFFHERMWTTNICARSKIRATCQGMDVIDVMTHFSHDHFMITEENMLSI